MQITSTNDSILCNYEVLELLKEKKRNTNNNLTSPNNEIIERNTLKYLEEYQTKIITNNTMKLFIEQLKNENIKLTKAEYLVLLNHMPTHPVEIYLVSYYFNFRDLCCC